MKTNQEEITLLKIKLITLSEELKWSRYWIWTLFLTLYYDFLVNFHDRIDYGWKRTIGGFVFAIIVWIYQQKKHKEFIKGLEDVKD